MKNIKKYIKYLVFSCFMLLYSNAKAGVNGFTLTNSYTSQNPISPGFLFPINASFNWTPNTTSAILKINYNSALVSFSISDNTNLPSCIVVTNVNNQAVLTFSNLDSCANSGSLLINVNFRFIAPGTCTGNVLPSLFDGILTDNLSTTQNASCTAYSLLNNQVSLSQNFSSFNQATGEITFNVYYRNSTFFKINNPKWKISLGPSLGATISSIVRTINGTNYIYSASGNIITPNASHITGQHGLNGFSYTIKLPCNMGLGQTITSNIVLEGENCGIPNSIIAGPATASFLIPANTLPNPKILISNNAGSATGFTSRITNDGNTPLNLIATHTLPAVHLSNTTSVLQTSTQAGLVGAIKYFDCLNSPTASFPLIGTYVTDSNAPNSNTKKIEHSITNLLPGESVDLRLNYDLTSSCNGAPSNGLIQDKVSVAFNCSIPPNSCINCGEVGGGITDYIIVHNPQPIFECKNNYYNDIYDNNFICKKIDDEIDMCFEFSNSGDAPLLSSPYEISLPVGIRLISNSISYIGFSSNPVIVPNSNIKFMLPTLPVANTVYKICFKVKVTKGAKGGQNTIKSTYDCMKTYTICSFSALGVDKKVKGNKDNSFSNSGNGEANSDVEYEITLNNTGTEPLKNLVVIDRIPAIGNQSILGSPNSTAINNQFDMKMLSVPANTNFTVDYTPTRNMATGWPGTATVPAPIAGTWGTALNDGGVKFTFDPSFVLAPGATYSFTFKTKIPANTASGLIDCNTVGFIGTPAGQSNPINPAESNPVSITVKDPPCSCSLTSKPSIFWQSGSNGNTQMNELALKCGETYIDKLECFKPYMIRLQNPCGEDCSPDEVITKITYPNGSVVTSGSFLWADLIANQVGTYTVSMKVKCNGKWCTECVVKFKQTKKCEPPCDNCKDKVKATFNKDKSSATVEYHPKATTIAAAITLDGGADTYTEIRANIVDFNLFADKNCLQDYTTANNWGSLIGGTLNGFTSVITNYTGVSETNWNNNPREIVFKSVSPATAVNTNLNLTIKIPGVNPLSCCCINSTIFVKITYRNNKCEECFKIVKIDANQCPGIYKPGTISFNSVENSPQFIMKGINNIDSELLKSSSKKVLKK